MKGSYLTFCRKAGVGFCHDGAAWVPTDRFVVVTVPTMDRSRQTVKTAYPVK